MIERITSASNPRVKRLTNLRRKTKSRREEQAFILEGERLYRDTPRKFIKEIYMTEEFLDDKLGGAAQEDVTIITPQIMQKISDTDTPQGVLCVAKMPSYERADLLGDEKGGKPMLLLLENIQDPNNLGTVLRTAEAFGVSAVVMTSDCCDIYNPKVVRGSMGAVFRLPFYTVSGIAQFLSENPDLTSYAAVVDKDAEPITNISFAKSSVAVIGNEGNGLTESAVNACNHKITIPMGGKAESLNASAAASIIIWEMVK